MNSDIKPRLTFGKSNDKDLCFRFELIRILFSQMLSKAGNFVSSLLRKNMYAYGITPQFLHPLSAEMLLDQFPKTAKRTKTVCTIGPKTEHPDNAIKLINEGMNVARLNFSHGDHAEHLGQMKGVQDALKRRPHSHTSICLDTKGPEIRTGRMVDDKPIFLKKDQLLELTTDYSHMGTTQRIACSYQDLASSVQVGRKILFADGGVESVVKKIENGIVTVHIINDGKLGSKKNMCLPGVPITLPTIGTFDTYDIAEFGLKNKVDYIAVSFARYESDLIKLRQFMNAKDPVHGPNVHLISKIENHEAIHNLDEIIRGSDGIMVARGDLGMQVPIEKVVLLQKYIMGKTIDAGKYVVCATQMLESMESKPRPTRAEVSDITNAILDLTDATMTSGETTNGLFPTECARMLRKIAQQTELTTAYKRIFEHKKNQIHADKQILGAVALSFELTADLIFVETDNLKFLNQLSALRPRAYICVFTDNPVVKNLTAINFGVYCFPKNMIKYPDEFVGTLGKDFIPLSRPQALILHLQLDKHHKIVNHRVTHHKKPDLD